MNGLLSASKLMTAAEVREQCKKALKNPALLIVVELEVKQKLFSLSKKKAS
ncbi:hypothetical protein K7T73_13145 [Bacillus badius]|uniref:hypothetical protein n=1 Tax=Bacillus badius TaxID=1455 RepID=UPI001CBEC02B|nr:hypothetical protein [Bacillus badius]UAT29545.1 hypothetical protein K7T73_13145 [Bacillus badius]